MATRFVSKARQGAKILLIDDNRSGLMARRAVLEELGYTTKGLSCPHEALEACEPGSFDLIVTDYRLPGMNGIEFIRELRTRDPKVPVIMLSGYVEALGLTEKSTGADAVIMKSSNEVHHLVRTANRLLNMPPKRKPAVSEKAPVTPAAKAKEQGAG
jgi:CheY-like chemotaxis protein